MRQLRNCHHAIITAVFPGLLAGLYCLRDRSGEINPSLTDARERRHSAKGCGSTDLIRATDCFDPIGFGINLGRFKHLPKRRQWAHLVVWFWPRSIAN